MIGRIVPGIKGYFQILEDGLAGKMRFPALFASLLRAGRVPWSPGITYMKILGIIPARYESSRFPGKPLVSLAGKTLIQRVIEQCQKADNLSEVIVATDDERIAKEAEKHARVVMTRRDHPSGTDRIAEVAGRETCDAVVNVQGDEPLIDPGVINQVAGALQNAEMSTAAAPITDTWDYANPNSVKVVINQLGKALYFSRRTIPFLRDHVEEGAEVQMAAFPFLKHLGIYGYRKETLLKLVEYPVSPLEQAEKLEQLRALDNGIQIQVEKVDYESIGVDTPEDAARVEAMLSTT